MGRRPGPERPFGSSLGRRPEVSESAWPLPLVLADARGLRSHREAFVAQLCQEMRGPLGSVRVTWHRNQYRMVQIRCRAGVWHFRLHRAFLTARPSRVQALARYALTHDPKAASELREVTDSLRSVQAQPSKARGTYFDLSAVYDALNVRFFAGAIVAQIAWLEGEDWPGLEQDRELSADETSGLAMAAYCVETREIWVHRSLDAEDIPRVYLDWVVFHEMLHQAHEMPMQGRARCHHGPSFRRAEAQFPGRAQALAWERAHRDRLERALARPVQRLG